MRPVHEIAREIFQVWGAKGKGVYFGARPYLEAMLTLSDRESTPNYFADSFESVVLYGLSNMAGFRGPEARALKAELKAHVS